MIMKKDNLFAWNETIQQLTNGNESIQPDILRIDLSDSEIERLIKGEIIQTQYSWLQIGKRMK